MYGTNTEKHICVFPNKNLLKRIITMYVSIVVPLMFNDITLLWYILKLHIILLGLLYPENHCEI